mmetsp:Transcript_17871/g.25441  ORF Transcript_17871/g.25441 Transcript_17871/m.25441 type:complete len:99 (+) Transcript_17871:252-548(+)
MLQHGQLRVASSMIMPLFFDILQKLIQGPSTEKCCDNELKSCSSEESGKNQNGPVVPPKITSMKTLEARAAFGKSPSEIKFFKHLHAALKRQFISSEE